MYDSCSVLLCQIVYVLIEGVCVKIVCWSEFSCNYIILSINCFLEISPMGHIDNTLQLKWDLMDQIKIYFHLKLFVSGHKTNPIWLIFIIIFIMVFLLCKLLNHIKYIIVLPLKFLCVTHITIRWWLVHILVLVCLGLDIARHWVHKWVYSILNLSHILVCLIWCGYLSLSLIT